MSQWGRVDSMSSTASCWPCEQVRDVLWSAATPIWVKLIFLTPSFIAVFLLEVSWMLLAGILGPLG